MTKTMKTRTAYVIYVPSKGYMKNKAGEFIKDFEHARLFSTDKAASSSIEMNRKLNKYKKRNLGVDEPAFVIPVAMQLDPRKLFKTVLRGEQ